MSNYPDRYPRHNFTTHINISHTPTGFKFYQNGGRIVVLQKSEESGFYEVFSDFSTPELQIENTFLTEAALRRAAIVWLKGHLQ